MSEADRYVDELVRLLDLAAKGREEYADHMGETDNVTLITMKADLLSSARTFRQAIRLAEGDLTPLYGILPSWRWNYVPLPEPSSQETPMTETPTKLPVPTRYITEIGKSLSGEPIAIAWDFCRCGQYVVNCACVGGPFEPRYITAMRDRETAIAAQREADKAERAEKSMATPVSSTPVASKPSVDPANPLSLSTAVANKCDVCGKAATTENADQNDDGTWTHHDCQ